MSEQSLMNRESLLILPGVLLETSYKNFGSVGTLEHGVRPVAQGIRIGWLDSKEEKQYFSKKIYFQCKSLFTLLWKKHSLFLIRLGQASPQKVRSPEEFLLPLVIFPLKKWDPHHYWIRSKLRHSFSCKIPIRARLLICDIFSSKIPIRARHFVQ